MKKRITDFIKFLNHKRKGKSPYAAEFLSGKNKVLDIGCGGGELERQFFNFFGLDISLKNLRKSDFLCEGRLIQGDATMLPGKDESFDGIILNNVIEHLYPEQALLALREIDRVLKKGGCFLLATDNQHNYISRAINLPVKLVRNMLNRTVDQIPFHKAYSLSQFNGMLIGEGFEVNHFYTFRFSIAINPSLKIAHFMKFILNQLEKALIRLRWVGNWGDIILANCQKPGYASQNNE